MKTCMVDNCLNKYEKAGYCCRHYTQMRRFGKILKRTIRDPNDYITEGDICKIGCYNKQCELVGYAIIDIWNIEKCKIHKWYFDGRYVVCSNGTLYLHQFILNLTGKEIIGDHKDKNTWNNKEENLRACSYSQNNCNRKPNNTAKYKGIHWSTRYNKWGAQIQKNGVYYRLGFFKTSEEAALVYNKAAKELHGEFACLNKL
jgi:hypothetical protein